MLDLTPSKNLIIDTMRLLLYKNCLEIFEKIDYENEDFYTDPFLFTYFNNLKSFNLEFLHEMTQGYFCEKKSPKIKLSYNTNNISYLPNLGYFYKESYFPFQGIQHINFTKIEIIKERIIYFNQVFKDRKENIIGLNKIEISNEINDFYLESLTNAINYIRECVPEQFLLIEQCCKKVVLFRTNPENTNSFATINAHGIAFLNVFQEEYDEVFFVDDIAHQTGHIILTTLLFDRKKYFIIDENINISIYTKNKLEYRSLYVLLHALYTYYTTLLCLNNCIKKSCFNERQKSEAQARIGFYLIKYRYDLENFEKIVKYHGSIYKMLTKDGVLIYKLIKDYYSEMYSLWYRTLNYNYENQPYNFTFSNFNEINN